MRIKRTTFAMLLTLSLSLGTLFVVPAHAYGWDSNTKVTLSERSAENPALVYNSNLGRMFIAWIGTNCCTFNLNFISSSDMRNWGNKITTGLSAASAASCLVGLDMVYDPDDSNMYVVYVESSGNSCQTQYLEVFHTYDGTSLSTSSTLLTSSGLIAAPSITYNTNTKELVVFQSNEVFTSSDGVNWSSGTVLSGIGATVSNIRYINGYYWLSYRDSSTNLHVGRSSDLSGWTEWSYPNQQSNYRPVLSYDTVEGDYHLSWEGTDLSSQLNDMTAPDASAWGPVDAGLGSSQYTQRDPSLAYNPSASVLLISWAGTDCCFGGSINVMQYH